jgi:hypothetical protein
MTTAPIRMDKRRLQHSLLPNRIVRVDWHLSILHKPSLGMMLLVVEGRRITILNGATLSELVDALVTSAIANDRSRWHTSWCIDHCFRSHDGGQKNN